MELQIDDSRVNFVVALPYSGRSELMRKFFYEESLRERFGIIFNLPREDDLINSLKDRPGYEGADSDFQKAIEKIIDNKREIILIINSLDSIENEKRLANWKVLITLAYRFPKNIKLVIGQGCEDVVEAKELLRDFYGYYLSNRIYLPLEKGTELGGGYWYFENRLKEKPELNNEEGTLNDDLIRYGCEVLWDSCSERSQQQLLKLVKREETGFSDYLTKTGMVKEGKLFSPVMEKWLIELLEKSINKIEVEKLLSYQENEVYKALKNSGGKPVSRDQLAGVMWPNKAVDNYSDWAIDQIICKIRRKTGDIGEKRKIKTVRNVGFVYQE